MTNQIKINWENPSKSGWTDSAVKEPFFKASEPENPYLKIPVPEHLQFLAQRAIVWMDVTHPKYMEEVFEWYSHRENDLNLIQPVAVAATFLDRCPTTSVRRGNVVCTDVGRHPIERWVKDAYSIDAYMLRHCLTIAAKLDCPDEDKTHIRIEDFNTQYIGYPAKSIARVAKTHTKEHIEKSTLML